MKSAIVIIIAAAAVFVLVIAGVDFFNSSKRATQSPSTPPAVPTSAVTSPVIPVTSAAPTPPSNPTPSATPLSLEQNLTNLQQAIINAATTGKSQEVNLTISEAEANTQAANLLPNAQMPPDVPLEIKGVNVDFKPGNSLIVDIETVLRIINIPVKVRIQTQVGVKDGKPVVTINEVSFTGSALVPQSLKDSITSLVKQKVDELIAQLTEVPVDNSTVSLEYRSINIQEEQAAITVIAKLKT